MDAIKRAIEHCGGAAKLATQLGVTTQAVCFWRDGERGLPAKKCSAIELATGGAVTRQELRPDDYHLIWPELAPGAPHKKEVA